MKKRALVIFAVILGLMVAGAGIYAFASESDEDPTVGSDVVLVQEDVDSDAGEGDEPPMGPHGALLDEVLDELVAAGTIDSALADEIRDAYDAKLEEKLAEWDKDFRRFGPGFGGFLDKDGLFDLDGLAPWIEGLELDEELLDLFEDGLTPDEMEELKGLLPEGFKPGLGFGGFPFGPLDELGIDIEEFLEDGQIDADEREMIHDMLEEQFGEGFDLHRFGRRFGRPGPSGDDAEASLGIRLGV